MLFVEKQRRRTKKKAGRWSWGRSCLSVSVAVSIVCGQRCRLLVTGEKMFEVVDSYEKRRVVGVDSSLVGEQRDCLVETIAWFEARVGCLG